MPTPSTFARSIALAAVLATPPLAGAPERASAQTTAARTAPAQGEGLVSAPIEDVRYEVQFDSATGARNGARVTMSFRVAGATPVLLSLPAWTPGSYELSDFAKYVSGFTATAGARALRWDKADYDTWRVHPASAGPVTVAYDVRMTSLDVGSAWASGDFAMFNGTAVFMFADGRPLEFASRVSVRTTPGWKVATGMAPAGEAGAYQSASYHDLVDMPFFVGRFDLDSARIADRWVRLATWPVGAVAGRVRAGIWEQHRRMIPPMIQIFGETPFDGYTTMFMLDSASGGGSALEHQNSHVGIYSPLLLPTVLLPSITAHEIVHAWNVKRLRPADLVPYRYDRRQPTPWLWVSEGITDYYADLALVRGDLIDSTGFAILTFGKMQEVANVPVVALEDASLDTWIQPVQGTGTIYYQKGSLAGLLLDILIRDASDDRRSLDDVMRELYAGTYKQGRGFTSEDFWGAVRRAAGGKSFADFERRYIDGRDPFPYETVLPLAGMRLAKDSTREPFMGLETREDSLGMQVVALVPGSAAEEAGIRLGDYLVSVGDIQVRDEMLPARFKIRYRASEGQQVPVRVRRDGREERLTMRVSMETNVEERLEYVANASAKAARIRSGILRGTTTR